MAVYPPKSTPLHRCWQHSHSRFLFIIGCGYLAMQVLMIFMTDGGLFAMHLDYALKITLYNCNKKLYELKYNFPE
jgi:hypothetical protein